MAETDKLNLTVCDTLDRANRTEWRSLDFDPLPLASVSSPSAGNDEEADIKSSTRPRIFILFPRVIAFEKPSGTDMEIGSLPGSWQQSEEEPHPIETCIHTGTGLPEWSPLVVKGKEEEEERENFIRRLKQEANAWSSRRNGGHSRRQSTASLGSGPPSPTAQWSSGGAMKNVEE
jgi:hypothetical protein